MFLSSLISRIGFAWIFVKCGISIVCFDSIFRIFWNKQSLFCYNLFKFFNKHSSLRFDLYNVWNKQSSLRFHLSCLWNMHRSLRFNLFRILYKQSLRSFDFFIFRNKQSSFRFDMKNLPRSKPCFALFHFVSLRFDIVDITRQDFLVGNC